MKKVIIGMSGGVDSSVAALLLQQQGFDVHGVFMKNWDDENPEPTYRKKTRNECPWEQDFADMRAVCHQLDIPYTTFNFTKEYRELVFNEFLHELQVGRTPNPDILCNQEIKFRLFFNKALGMTGAGYVATGHYAAIKNHQLCRPRDQAKDQTYFLYRIDPHILSRILFPLQDLTKQEVRTIAHKAGLATAQKKDSTGICFIGNIRYSDFIQTYLPKKPGIIETTNGKIVGEHDGLHLYTIGQRHGIHIGGTGPYYVTQKDIKRNVLIVTNNAHDPQLYQTVCIVHKLHWLGAITLPIQCSVQVRYRQAEAGGSGVVRAGHSGRTECTGERQ